MSFYLVRNDLNDVEQEKEISEYLQQQKNIKFIHSKITCLVFTVNPTEYWLKKIC